PQLDDLANVWRLLAQIARRKAANAANRYAAGRRDPRRELPSDFAAVGSPTPSPQEVAIATELLESIPKEEVEIVRLRADGHTYPEIAERLGCSEKTVRSRMKSLRKLWERDK